MVASKRNTHKTQQIVRAYSEHTYSACTCSRVDAAFSRKVEKLISQKLSYTEAHPAHNRKIVLNEHRTIVFESLSLPQKSSYYCRVISILYISMLEFSQE